MAAGEYVSVKSQEDTERADLQMEAEALANNREEEERELAAIYQSRGLDQTLALEVARQRPQRPLEPLALDEGIVREHDLLQDRKDERHRVLAHARRSCPR